MIHCHSRCKQLATRKREHAKELSIFGRGLDALDKPEAWLQRQHERHVVVWGKMWVAKCRFFHFSSGVQSTLFGVVSQARQGAKSQSHLHTYLPMLLWHWCTHVRTCQYRFGHCARTYSCTEIGTRSVCCTIIAFFPHIPAGIQGTVSERQLSLQEQYIDNFISSYIVLNVPEWPREWIS